MTSTTSGRPLRSIQVQALNTAANSRGSIHDDEKAREMGYRGGLVPGVTVLAYMARLMRESFGNDWAIDGSFHGLIRRPVYEADMVTIVGQVTGESERGVSVHLEVHDPEGNVCAVGEATTNAPLVEA